MSVVRMNENVESEVSDSSEDATLSSTRPLIKNIEKSRPPGEKNSEDEELENLLKEELGDGDSLEARFAKMRDLPDKGESRKWKAISSLHFVLFLYSGVNTILLFLNHWNNSKYLITLDNYDSGNMTVIFGLVGGTCCLTSFLGSMVTWAASIESKRGRMKFILYASLEWTVSLLLLVLAMLIACIVVNGLIPRIFVSGLMGSMKKYNSDTKLQKTIHLLQEDNHCCGNINYTEWFSIDFSEDFHKTDVGFPSSCCNIVKHQKELCRSKAAFMQASLLQPFTSGCLDVLMKMFKRSLAYSFALLAVVLLGDGLCVSLTISNMQASKTYDQFVVSERERMLALKFRREKEAKSLKLAALAPFIG